jgi:hypothetical protein
VNASSVDLKDRRNGWVLFAERYHDPIIGWVRGYSGNLGNLGSHSLDSLTHRLRTKYVSQFILAFLKEKAKADKNKQT